MRSFELVFRSLDCPDIYQVKCVKADSYDGAFVIGESFIEDGYILCSAKEVFYNE